MSPATNRKTRPVFLDGTTSERGSFVQMASSRKLTNPCSNTYFNSKFDLRNLGQSVFGAHPGFISKLSDTSSTESIPQPSNLIRKDSLLNLESASKLYRQSKTKLKSSQDESSDLRPPIQSPSIEEVYKSPNRQSVSVACKRITSHMKVINIDFDGNDRPKTSETRFKYVINLPRSSISRQVTPNTMASGDMTRIRSRCFSTGHKLNKPPPAAGTSEEVLRYLLLILAVAFLAGLFFYVWSRGMNGLLALTSLTKPLIQPKRELTRWEQFVKFGRNLFKVFQNLAKHLFH